MRLDKYLKVSRLIKRRTLAKEVAAADRVEVNGRVAKPATDIKPGDKITLRYGNRTLTVEVVNIAENARKNEASGMYKVLGETSTTPTE
ncbi:MAG: RNA-binding S4 domain-containing protein [Symbiobacteriaceae bacterium]|nr:RNA-binding S4 domain-containing protein [Symbiobacteriaceae bacterium]